MGRISVLDIIDSCSDSLSRKSMSSAEVNKLIDKWLPKRDTKRIFDVKSKSEKFSGGEQRLLSVFSAIATRPDSDFLIIDEPL